MTQGMSALFWGIITFSLLVVVHEGGHFLAARLFGVKVHEFMIGLPAPALRFRGKKTTYGITALPLGGYVRIAGMEPGPENPDLGSVLAAVTEASEPLTAEQVASRLGLDAERAQDALVTLEDWDAIGATTPRGTEYASHFPRDRAVDPVALLDEARSVTYRALSYPKRIALLCMGVINNLLMAVLVFTIVLSTFGYLEDTGLVGSVSAGSAAQKAGIVAGDRVVSVGGTRTRGFQQLLTTVGGLKPGARVRIVFQHDSRTVARSVVLGKNPSSGNALLGVSPKMKETRPGVARSFVLSFSYIGATFVAILGFFNPRTFQATVHQSSSVIGAAYYAADAAKAGPLDYAGLVAALSLSLGVINILPIPPLDGGKVALEILEWLRRRPLSRRVALSVSAAGAALLFALIGYLMYADVVRIFGS